MPAPRNIGSQAGGAGAEASTSLHVSTNTIKAAISLSSPPNPRSSFWHCSKFESNQGTIVPAQCWTAHELVEAGNVLPNPQMSNTGRGEHAPQTSSKSPRMSCVRPSKLSQSFQPAAFVIPTKYMHARDRAHTNAHVRGLNGLEMGKNQVGKGQQRAGSTCEGLDCLHTIVCLALVQALDRLTMVHVPYQVDALPVHVVTATLAFSHRLARRSISRQNVMGVLTYA